MSHVARSSAGLPDDATPMQTSQREKPHLVRDQVQDAFAFSYMNREMLVKSFMKRTCQTQGQWANDIGNNPEFNCCSFALVNSARMGKSRLINVTFMTVCFGIYINVSENPNGVPPPNARIRDWLLEHGAVSLGHHADLNIQSLILACGLRLQNWLHEKMQLNDLGRYPSLEKLCRDWMEYQSKPEFWDQILDIQAEQADELCQFSNLQRICQDLTSPYRNAALQELTAGVRRRLPGISQEDWNRTDSTWYTILAAEFDRRLRESSEAINGLIAQFPSEGTRAKWLDEWSCTGKRLVWPAWILAIDDMRTLLRGGDNHESVFHTVRNTSRHFPQGPHSIILIMTDSTSKISNFAPPGDVSPCRRHMRNTFRFGSKLFQPFLDIKCVDVHTVKEEKMGDLLDLLNQSKYGRAAFFAIASRLGAEAVVVRLQEKLGEPHPAASASILACMVTLNVNPTSSLAEELTASFFQKLVAISADRRQLFLRSCPETLLAIAARSLANWTKLFKILNQRGISDIDVGAHGETASQILLIMAIGEAEKELKITGLPSETRELTVYPVPLFNVLQKLGVYDYLEKPENLHALQHWEPFLKRAHVRVVQFARDFSLFTPLHVKNRFCRACAIMCPPNHEGVDGLFPLYVSPAPFSSLSELKDAPLTTDRMSFVGLQFKNQAACKPKEYKEQATSNMKAHRIFHQAIAEWPRETQYVSLLIDVGANKDGQPRVWIFQNNNQLSIVIRGIRPSHILTGLTPLEKMELNASFQRFISNAPKLDRKDETVEEAKASEGNMFDADAVTVVGNSDLLVRALAASLAASRILSFDSPSIKQAERDKLEKAKSLCDRLRLLHGKKLEKHFFQLWLATEKLLDLLNNRVDSELQYESVSYSSDPGEEDTDNKPAKRAKTDKQVQL